MTNYQKYRKWCKINGLDEVKAQNMQAFNSYIKNLEAVGKMPIFTSKGVVLLNKPVKVEQKPIMRIKITTWTLNGATWLDEQRAR